MLVETANYYLADEEGNEYVQFNAWEVDRYTEAFEASVAYTFNYNDAERDDEEFTVYIERQESESEAWEITTIEDLMDTFVDVPISLYKNVMFMEDGMTETVIAREGEEIAFLFQTERSDLDIAVEFDEENRLIYSTGTFGDSIQDEDGFYYSFRSFGVEYDAEQIETSVAFTIKGMNFGSGLDIQYNVNFELEEWDSQAYYYAYNGGEVEDDSTEYEIRNMN